MAENDAKLGSQNDPKSIQNRRRKGIEILIDFWIDLDANLASFSLLKPIKNPLQSHVKRHQKIFDLGIDLLAILAPT